MPIEWRWSRKLELLCLQEVAFRSKNDSARKFKFCFCCLNGSHRANQCALKRTFDRNGFAKKHNRLLHRDQKAVSKSQTSDSSTNSVLTANSCSGLLLVVSVPLSNGNKTVDTFAVWDTGSTLSFIDDEIRRQLKVEGEKLTLSVAGRNGTKDVVRKKCLSSCSRRIIMKSYSFTCIRECTSRIGALISHT